MNIAKAQSRFVLLVSGLMATVGSASFLMAHDGPHRSSAQLTKELDRGARVIEFLEARAVARPDDSIVLSKLASARLQQARRTGAPEDFARAERTFRALLQQSPESGGGHAGLAYALLGGHRFAEALATAREAAGWLPDSPEILALIGDCHFALGHYVEAEMAFARLLDSGLTLHSLARMAQIHEVRGRYDEAVQCMSDALQAGTLLDESSADLAWCRTLLGDMALDHDDLDTAEAHYRASLRLHDGGHVARWRLAEIASRRGQHDQASAALRELVRQHPIPKYLIALGEALVGTGRAEEADGWFRKAEQQMLLNLQQGEVGHVRELVEFWLAHDRHTQRALELAQRDLEEVRQDAGAHETMAWALHKVGRHEEAVRYMRFALRPGKTTPQLRARAEKILQATDHPVMPHRAVGRKSMQTARVLKK